jgi:hypothetical protein
MVDELSARLDSGLCAVKLDRGIIKNVTKSSHMLAMLEDLVRDKNSQ